MAISEKSNQGLMKAIRRMHTLVESDDLERVRASQENISALLKHRELNYEPFQVGEIPSEWVSVKRSHMRKFVIFYCHGGGYNTGSFHYARSITNKLSSTTSMDVLSFDYRLAPEHPYPSATEDAMAVWDYLMHLGYGARDVIVAGDSAGGNQALSLVLKLKEQKRILPRGLILFSPWTDLTGSGKSYETKVDVDPILNREYLDNAIEAEVDALADGTDTFVATVMEHIELAGIHSGDSACAIPPVTIAPKHIRTIEAHAAQIAQDSQGQGIPNVQLASCNDEAYIIEANPRASRTVPIVSKVTGISLARYATEIMLGKKLKELGLKSRACRFIGVKEAVFPFNMFPEVAPVLGPEMRATGEVMGIAANFGMAYYKAQEAAGCILPTAGKVLVTVSDRDKKFIEPIARDLISLGFTIVSTGGTAEYLRGQGVETEVVNKLHEGRPNLGDMITNKQIDLIINTPVDRTSMIDDSFIRMQSIQKKIPYMTTIAAARATVEGIRSAQHVKVSPRSLQEYHS